MLVAAPLAAGFKLNAGNDVAPLAAGFVLKAVNKGAVAEDGVPERVNGVLVVPASAADGLVLKAGKSGALAAPDMPIATEKQTIKHKKTIIFCC